MSSDESAQMAYLQKQVAAFQEATLKADAARQRFNYQALLAIIGCACTLLVARVPH